MEMPPQPAFVVETPSDVRDALGRAKGKACILLSAEAAAASLGCLGFLTLVEEGMRDARDAGVVPDAEIMALLDCTGAPGRAAEAIAFFARVAEAWDARGAPVFGVVLDGMGAAQAELVACASELGVPAFTERPPLEPVPPLSPQAVQAA